MPNVGQVLKSEITRLSKKAVRQETQPMRSAVGSQRKQVAALRVQLQQVLREVAALRRELGKQKREAPEDQGTKLRFTAKGLRSSRAKLGLSAEDFGKLIGVTGQTIYSWEAEKSSPRAAQLPAIAGLRAIGKREAHRRLEQLQGDQAA